MFVSQEKSTARKLFQKPNILRKNPKPVSSTKLTEASQGPIKLSQSGPPELKGHQANIEKITKHKCSKPCHSVKKPQQRSKVDTHINNEYHGTVQLNENISLLITNVANGDAFEINACNSSEENIDWCVTDFTSSVTADRMIQLQGKYSKGNISCKVENSESEKHLRHLHYDASDNLKIQSYEVDSKDFTVSSNADLQAFNSISLPTDVINIVETPIKQLEEEDGTPHVVMPCISHVFSILKCDVPDCNKQFTNEQTLKKHKNGHAKGGQRVLRQSIECPVKQLSPDRNEPCGRMYLQREDLLKHLKDDHTLEDASYRCELCGRRFFWVSGLRAHGRAHSNERRARTPHACPWPGCARVFLQACRLKEHTRAHTGDRPYACRYPNCGWSFRTASKLVRHVRQHTGERRHRCKTCGRAFLRAEHLREHATRHDQPQHRPRHACTAHGCEQTFSNMSYLYLHMKKVHKSESDDKKMPDETSLHVEPVCPVVDEFHLREGDEPTIEPSGPEWQAARTHCTWPLAAIRAPAPAPRSPVPSPEPQGDTGFILKSDVQVELFEASDSNIYTVRSDLFLHGNVLHSEDSEGVEGPRVRQAVGDADEADGMELVLLQHSPTLDLLDPPPTSHLMEEELMYADAAVDESSFHVLLFSGDEIN